MQHDISHPASRTPPGRFGPLLRGEKGLDLCVQAGDIPAFLLEANDLLRSGKVGQAKALLSKDRIDPLRHRAAADLAPHDANAGCMWLWALHYVPGPGREFFWEQYRRWGRHFASQDRGAVDFPNVRDPDRRLRVGFLSPDFREHSVAKTFEPFLDGYDRDAMEVYGYGRVRNPDAFTERLSRKFTRYQQVGGLGDEPMAERIRQDGVDILVEIGGHVEDHCLGVMARRPAPVQVDFGCIDTTGLEQMDYRLTDAILDPPSLSQGYGEELIRLPGGLPAYAPPAISPPVTALPARRSGHVTFGSFNNQAKVNTYVLSLWGRVLKAVRERMLQSPLCSPRRMGQEMEAAFRQMWRRWCERPIQNQESRIQNIMKGGR